MRESDTQLEGHIEARDSIPDLTATAKCGNHTSKLKGRRPKRGKPSSDFRGHRTTWESITPTQGATTKHRSQSLRTRGGGGGGKSWESISRPQGAKRKRGNPSSQHELPHLRMGNHHPTLGVTPKACPLHKLEWNSITLARDGMPTRGGQSPQLQRPHQGVGVQHPTPNVYRGTTSPQLRGPHLSVGLHHPTSKNHAKARNSIAPTRGPTSKEWESITQHTKPRRSMGVHQNNSRRHTERWQLISRTQEGHPTPKHASSVTGIEEPHQSVGIHHGKSRGHAEARDSFTPTWEPTPKY